MMCKLTSIKTINYSAVQIHIWALKILL